MSKFKTDLVVKVLSGKYVSIYEPFTYYSTLLDADITVPPEFICDFESVPLLKGTSNRGGVLHDYLCRKNSVPKVTKQQAASVYFEAMELRDTTSPLAVSKYWRVKMFIKRWVKSSIVRVIPGYFNKLIVEAIFKEF